VSDTDGEHVNFSGKAIVFPSIVDMFANFELVLITRSFGKLQTMLSWMGKVHL
jgi:hypothetical protein